MKIAIIGSGNVGSALAEKWSAAGHAVVFGTREPSNFKGKAAAERGGVTATTIAAAVASAEVILLATPATAAIDVAKSLGDTTGKVIIDAMNIVGGRGPEGFRAS